VDSIRNPKMSVLSKPYFHDEEAAFQFVEGITSKTSVFSD